MTQSFQSIVDRWPSLHPIAPEALSYATAMVHRAAQFIAMTGKHFLPHEADDSHTNLSWIGHGGYLAGHPIPTHRPIRAAIQPLTLTLALLDEVNQPIEVLLGVGKTKEELIGQWKEMLAAQGLEADRFALDLHYDIPAFETDEGAPFQIVDKQAFQAFTHLRQAGYLVTAWIATLYAESSPVATWPHHFDVGGLMVLSQSEQGEPTRTIGYGMAINDELVPEHYLYVTHWQAAGRIEYGALPHLPMKGYWHQGDQVLAILPMSSLYTDPQPLHQASAARDFLESAIEISKGFMGLT